MNLHGSQQGWCSRPIINVMSCSHLLWVGDSLEAGVLGRAVARCHVSAFDYQAQFCWELVRSLDVALQTLLYWRHFQQLDWLKPSWRRRLLTLVVLVLEGNVDSRLRLGERRLLVETLSDADALAHLGRCSAESVFLALIHVVLLLVVCHLMVRWLSAFCDNEKW